MNQNYYKKIAVFDVDGTLIRGQVQQSLLFFLFSKREIGFFYFTAIFFWFFLYKMHIVNNIKFVFEYGVKHFRGKKISEISRLIDQYISISFNNLVFSESRDLLLRLKNEGYTIIILSTAVDAVVSKISKIFDVDDYICTKLEVDNDKYTGNLDGDIIYGYKKAEVLNNYILNNKYSLDNVEVYADHKSDLPVLKMADKAYVINPDHYMRKVAEKEGFDIINLH